MRNIKSVLLFISMFFISSSLWADYTVTILPNDMRGMGSKEETSPVSVTVEGVTFQCDNGWGSEDIWCFAGSTITLSATRPITQARFDFWGNHNGSLESVYANLTTFQSEWSRWTKYLARMTRIEVVLQGDTPQANDFTITDLPQNLNFDVTTTHTPIVLHYTTSCKGKVEVSTSSYISSQVDEVKKTITITPLKKMPGPQVYYIRQKGDGTYGECVKSFQLNITQAETDVHTATFWVNGNPISATSYKEGVPVVFPSDPAAISDKTFWGWVMSYPIHTETEQAPTRVQGYIPMFEYDMDFYAIYADEVAPGVFSWFTTDVKEPAVRRPVITVPDVVTGLSSVTATITCPTSSASIYYRLGDNTSWKKYSGAVSITGNTTIYAKAVKGNDESHMSYRTVTFASSIAAPIITLTPATEYGEHTYYATITTETGNASIFYTIDGSTPTKDFNQIYYPSAPPIVSKGITIKAVAYYNGGYSDVTVLEVEPALQKTISALTINDKEEFFIQGIVTARNENYMYVQDEDAAIRVALFLTSTTAAPGDEVQVKGTVIGSSNKSLVVAPTSITVLSHGNVVPPVYKTYQQVLSDYNGAFKLRDMKVTLLNMYIYNVGDTYLTFNDGNDFYYIFNIDGSAFSRYEIVTATCNLYDVAGELEFDNATIACVAETVTIGEDQYVTYFRKHATDLSASDIQVFTAKVENNVVKLLEVETKLIPANTPVILYSKTAQQAVRYPLSDATSVMLDNELVGINSTTTVSSTSGNKHNYYFKMEDNKPVFISIEDSRKLYGDDAYLSTAATTASRLSVERYVPDGITDIGNDAKPTATTDAWFTLDGRQLPSRPSRAGIYLRNGHKIAVR